MAIRRARGVFAALVLLGGAALSAELPPAPPEGVDFTWCVRALDALHPELSAARGRVDALAQGLAATSRPFVPRLGFRLEASDGAVPVAGAAFTFYQPSARAVTQRLGAELLLLGKLPWGLDYQFAVQQGFGWYSDQFSPLSPAFDVGLRLQLSQPLLRGAGNAVGKRARALALARMTEEEARAAQTADALVRRALDAYFDALLSHELRALHDVSLTYARSHEEATRKVIKAGLAPATEQVLARQTTQLRLAQQSAAALAFVRALELLSATLGLPPAAAPLNLRAEGPVLADVLEEGAVERALARSPELALVEARLRQLREGLLEAENDARPDLRVTVVGELRGLAGQSGCAGGYLLDGVTPCAVPLVYQGGYGDALRGLGTGNLYQVGLRLEGELPLQRAPRLAPVHERRRALLALEETRTHLRQQLELEVRRTVRELRDYRAHLELVSRSVEATREVVEAEQQRFLLGRSTSLALLQTQDALMAAMRGAAEARTAQLRASARLRLLTGALREALAQDEEGETR